MPYSDASIQGSWSWVLVLGHFKDPASKSSSSGSVCPFVRAIYILATMERTFFVGGNWKMNGSKVKIDEILKNLAESDLSPSTGLFTEHQACKVKWF